MKIEVIHAAFEDQAETVATVDYVGKITDGLEYAYRWTQNIMDSWSMKMPQDGNDAVTVVKPLHKDEQGKAWGHRSTSVGDYMRVGGELYRVAGCGFEDAEAVVCGKTF